MDKDTRTKDTKSFWMVAQAMDLISVAQETGEVSADAYTMAYNDSQGILPPPQLVGIEDQVCGCPHILCLRELQY